jgi:cation diffusion facilitator CzcD-associated flavoprotein CzcO
VLLSNDYFPALQAPNVELVTDGIAEVRERSIVTAGGAEHEVDAIIFGTGFHVTDMPFAERVRGREGRTLAEEWAGSMQAHHGTAIAGFPNLFMLLGPNTGLGHNSVVFMIEAQIAYVASALQAMRAQGASVAEVRREAQEASNAEIQERLQGTVWNTGGCASWYIDRNGDNPIMWPGFTFTFRRLTRRFDPAAYIAVSPAMRASPAPEAA